MKTSSYVRYISLNIGQAPDEEVINKMILDLENRYGKNHIAERQYWFTYYEWRFDREVSCFAIYRDYEKEAIKNEPCN